MYYIYQFNGKEGDFIFYKLHSTQGFGSISLAREQVEQECDGHPLLTTTSFVVFHQEGKPAAELEMEV
jgi:hypothetical protein